MGMMASLNAERIPRVLEQLRARTRALHRRLEERLDAVRGFADPQLRPALVSRFAALHVTAEAVLPAFLCSVDGLNMERRRRAPLLQAFAKPEQSALFPHPRSLAEALGMLYVLEGSTLGGRVILDALAKRGIADKTLGFLDVYGAETGRRWREFLTVLVRETRDDDVLIDEACTGAVIGFEYAEKILCGATE